jgi:hypothetical protein
MEATRRRAASRTLAQCELDLALDQFAEEPEQFAWQAKARARELNDAEIDLELADSSQWREPDLETSLPGTIGLRSPPETHFRAEVAAIAPLDALGEARLARRIEFARWRLEDVLSKGEQASRRYCPLGAETCLLFPNACRRCVELHSLRSEMVERHLWVLLRILDEVETASIPLAWIEAGRAALFRAVDRFDWRGPQRFAEIAEESLIKALQRCLFTFSRRQHCARDVRRTRWVRASHFQVRWFPAAPRARRGCAAAALLGKNYSRAAEGASTADCRPGEARQRASRAVA